MLYPVLSDFKTNNQHKPFPFEGHVMKEMGQQHWNSCMAEQPKVIWPSYQLLDSLGYEAPLKFNISSTFSSDKPRLVFDSKYFATTGSK